MLRGVYRYSGDPVDGLPVEQRLSGGYEGRCRLAVHGPLAVACGASAGRATADGIACTLDGHLYERANLARELELNVSSDAELIARGYRRYGEELLGRLRGRFAFVLWDEAQKRGLLGCDLLAVQPVFLWRGSGCMAFAGELRDLTSMLPSQPGPDPVGFVSWLGGWTVPSDHTLYEGVSRLPPGRLVDLEGDAPVRSYWEPRYSETSGASRTELAEGLRENVERAVARRLSTRSSGVVLSGGLDSSIVTAIAAGVKPSNATLGTYSAVFPGADYDEGWKVRSLTGALGIEPRLFDLAPQGALWLNLEHLKKWGQPLAGGGALVDMAMVMAAANDGVDVVLDGQTGDELFGCAPWLVADRLTHGRILAALDLARNWPGRETTGRERRYILKHWGLRGAAPHSLHRLARSRKDPSSVAPSWLLPAAQSRYAELEDRWAWKADGHGPRWWRFLADTLVQAPHRELRLDYLRNRASGAGVLSETPLYDFDLIDYSLRLPPQLAFNSAHSRPLARESVRNLVPDDVRLNNDKAVFSPFCFDMMAGADAPGIERLIAAPDAELGAYADLEQIRRLWHDRPKPEAGFATTSWGTVVWRLAAAESWLRSQSDPGFVDRMLARPDVRPPEVRPAAKS